MYSAVELKELTIKPKINDISLEVLREFYEMFLHPFIYTYTITQNDESKVMPPTNIDCELLFYSTYDNAMIHLGLEKEDDGDFYFPRTFFVEKLSKPEDKDIYIDNQE